MKPDPIKLLIVDDDPALLAVLELGLRDDASMEVTAISTAAAAVALLAEQRFDLVITDYSLDDAQVNGMEIMRCARRQSAETLVILITAFASMELTLEAIQHGAHDFLTKPFQLEELQLVVRNAVRTVRLSRELKALRARNAQLETALETFEAHEAQFGARVDQMIEELQRNGAVEAHPALGQVVLADPTRRRYQDQLGAYLKQSRSVLAEARATRLDEPAANAAAPEIPSASSSVEA